VSWTRSCETTTLYSSQSNTAMSSVHKSDEGGEQQQQLQPDTPAIAAVCRHWAKFAGYCAFRDTCKFLHPLELVDKDAPALETGSATSETMRRRLAFVRMKKQQEKGKQQQQEGGNKSSTKKWRRGKPSVRNGGRAGALARFITEKLGSSASDALAGGILDVGGGKGELAFQLHSLRRWNTTVIDPRRPNYDRIRKRCTYGLKDATVLRRAQPLYQDKAPTDGGIAADPRIAADHSVKTPAPAPQEEGEDVNVCVYDEEKTEKKEEAKNAHETKENEKNSESKQEDRFLVQWGHHVFETDLPPFIESCFPDPMTIPGMFREGDDAKFYKNYSKDIAKLHKSMELPAPDDPVLLGRLQVALRKCSAIVGLHSDQATEPMIDYALRHNKFFFVIPCCVFPQMFCKRRMPAGHREGEVVRKYEDFCAYLLDKDPRIKMEELAFEGRNSVLYFLP
jgi:hypothetical protein